MLLQSIALWFNFKFPSVHIVKNLDFSSLTFILLIITLVLNAAYCNTCCENQTCLEVKRTT